LKQRRRNDLEKLLSIFDQENRTRSHYILNVNADDFPEAYRPIIDRLIRAAVNEDVQIEMEMEDDYLKELQDKERLIEEQKTEIEEQRKALEEQRTEIDEKDKALNEQRKAIEELKKQLAEIRRSK
jgi:predicted RNase H-like nuclease (RuvC/YqgF family)